MVHNRFGLFFCQPTREVSLDFLELAAHLHTSPGSRWTRSRSMGASGLGQTPLLSARFISPVGFKGTLSVLDACSPFSRRGLLSKWRCSLFQKKHVADGIFLCGCRSKIQPPGNGLQVWQPILVLPCLMVKT